CESSFYRNTHLIVHKASHEGLKPFACDWPSCGQVFRSNSNLKHHCLIHTNEKPYKCEWPGCEAVFRSASSRIRHKVVHRATADFTCHWDGCGKSFKFKGNAIFVMPSVVQLWAMVWDGGQWTVDSGLWFYWGGKGTHLALDTIY
ncbi:unnamed protein product, partial [Oppiella nova]